MAADQLAEALNLAPERVYDRAFISEAIALLADTNWSEPTLTDEVKNAQFRLHALLVAAA